MSAQSLETERARLEAERAYYAQEREAAARIGSLGTAEQQYAATEQYLTQTIQAGLADFNQRYADITTQDAALRLQAENPQRFQEYQNYWTALVNADQQLQQVAQQRQRLSQQRVAEGTREFAKVAELHDQAWMARHPELVRDPEKLRQVQVAAQKYLEEKGVSKEEQAKHWTGQASFILRESISQEIVYDARRPMKSRKGEDPYAGGDIKFKPDPVATTRRSLGKKILSLASLRKTSPALA